MRLLESISILLNLLFLILLIIPRIKPTHVLYLSAWTSLLATLLHLFVEKYRWQMIPSYLLTFTILICVTIPSLRRYFLTPKFPSSVRSKRSISIRLLFLIFCAVAAILPPLALPVFSFEPPKGAYAVGTVQIHWTDTSRKEVHAYTKDPYRELNIQIWYPAGQPSRTPAPYFPDLDHLADGLSSNYHIPRFLFDYLGLVKTPAYTDLPISTHRANYPVILFSHGFPGGRYTNTFQTVELASHGYIVVSVEHTLGSITTVLPSGQYIGVDPDLPEPSNLPAWDQLINKVWVKDTQFVLNRLVQLNEHDSQNKFFQRLDLNRVGMLGHSYGGANAAQTMLADTRIRAAINMDGTFFGTGDFSRGLRGPFLFMSSDTSSTNPPTDKNLTDSQLAENGLTRQLYDMLLQVNQRKSDILRSGGEEVIIPHATHLNFSDFYNIFPVLAWFNGQFDNKSIQQKINFQTLQFFNKSLNYNEKLNSSQ